MQNTAKYYTSLFIIGGFGYCILELIWRGYTHPSMGLAGGISLCLIAVIGKYMKPLKFLYRCILSGLTITAVELIFGVIFNLWLKIPVWDYSQTPFNLMGQVCLLFTVLWCFISAPMLIVSELLRQKIATNKSS